MNLNLQKPIVFFDLETTGTTVGRDEIIEISMIKVYPDNTEEERTYLVKPKNHQTIPPNITALTGISDVDVVDKPTFAELAQEIKTFIGDSDLAGYNSNKFDVPLLVEEFLRAGVDFSLVNRNLVDVQNIFHKMESRTLSAAYKFYCKQELDAHHAQNDTRATLEVLKAQLDLYQDAEYKDKEGKVSKPVQNDMKQLASFSKMNNFVDLEGRIYLNDKCQECFNFGKHKDMPVEEVFRTIDPNYYKWLMDADFSLTTKQVIKRIKDMMV
ncbi:MAG: 3'-5' exonuclease [Bacteroidales bacterium]|nr:3'-5' exonuclease [Bacteroidales bacterium]